MAKAVILELDIVADGEDKLVFVLECSTCIVLNISNLNLMIALCELYANGLDFVLSCC